MLQSSDVMTELPRRHVLGMTAGAAFGAALLTPATADAAPRTGAVLRRTERRGHRRQRGHRRRPRRRWCQCLRGRPRSPYRPTRPHHPARPRRPGLRPDRHPQQAGHRTRHRPGRQRCRARPWTAGGDRPPLAHPRRPRLPAHRHFPLQPPGAVLVPGGEIRHLHPLGRLLGACLGAGRHAVRRVVLEPDAGPQQPDVRPPPRHVRRVLQLRRLHPTVPRRAFRPPVLGGALPGRGSAVPRPHVQASRGLRALGHQALRPQRGEDGAAARPDQGALRRLAPLHPGTAPRAVLLDARVVQPRPPLDGPRPAQPVHPGARPVRRIHGGQGLRHRVPGSADAGAGPRVRPRDPLVRHRRRQRQSPGAVRVLQPRQEPGPAHRCHRQQPLRDRVARLHDARVHDVRPDRHGEMGVQPGPRPVLVRLQRPDTRREVHDDRGGRALARRHRLQERQFPARHRAEGRRHDPQDHAAPAAGDGGVAQDQR